jgi:hypothetical protein
MPAVTTVTCNGIAAVIVEILNHIYMATVMATDMRWRNFTKLLHTCRDSIYDISPTNSSYTVDYNITANNI